MQAAQKCYEALKVKLSSEVQATQSRASFNSVTGGQPNDEDLFRENSRQSTAMDAKSLNKRHAEEKQESSAAVETLRTDIQLEAPDPKRSKERSRSPQLASGKGQLGPTGGGKGKDSKEVTEKSTSQG